MEDAVFEKKLKEIVNELDNVPAPHRDKLIHLARKTAETHKRLNRNVENLKSSLDYLRVSVKYLLFDLEATRRENAALKQRLEDQDKPEK